MHATSTRRLLQLLLVVFVAATSAPLALASSQEFELLKSDGTEFPRIRLYVQVPDASWSSASGQLEFAEKPSADVLSILDRIDEAEGAGKTPPEAPERPSATVEARVQQFLSQTDPKEGLLVVLLVDASTSMRGKASEQVQAHAAALMDELRPIDRVAVVAFADDSRTIVPPTTDHQRVVSGLQALDMKGFTKLYDALGSTIQTVVERAESPTLPGRRFLFVFSDGMDRGSVLKVENFSNIKDSRTQIYTVGVGSPGSGAKHKDLERISFLAGAVDKHFSLVEPDDLARAFEKDLEAFQRQLIVEADVPVQYWRKGTRKAVLQLQPTRGEPRDLEVAIPVESLRAEQREAYTAYEAKIAALNTWLKDQSSKAQEAESDETRLVVLVAGGGGLLVVLLFVFVFTRRARRRRQDREVEQLAQLKSVEQRLGDSIAQQGAQAAEAARKEASRSADQARVALAVLSAVDGPMKGRRFGVLKPRAVLGRDVDRCDVVFPSDDGDTAISRVHAELALGDGSWQATCLSDGGMAVNGQTLRKGDRYPLQLGDVIGLGKSQLRLEQS